MKNETNRRKKGCVWRVVRVLIIAYLALLIGAWALQSYMIYVPKTGMRMSPADLGLDYIEGGITTQDGVKIKSWFIPSKDENGNLKKDKLVLFCPGNAGNMSYHGEHISILSKLGVSILMFDYRGFGQSEGSPSEEGTYNDARAAWRHATENLGFNEKDIVIYGRSLGGAVATKLASENNPAGLILESTFSSMAEIGQEFFPILPVDLILKHKYRTIGLIPTIKCPILVMHSREDDLINFSHGQKLFEHANEPKTFIELPKGGHNGVMFESQKEMSQSIRQFLNSVSN